MINRLVTVLVRQRLSQYPAVALTGARQSGKTTLARSLSRLYFDLEQEADRLRLDLQWDSLAASERLVVLDEAQAWPEVFPRLRGAIDRDRTRTGRFLALGRALGARGTSALSA
jgi:predicted AAA+ superfamily ATPase